jgi:hypothetical protein
VTFIRTAKSRYTVESVEAPAFGPHFLVVRQPSGKVRKLSRADVGGHARFDAARAHFLVEQRGS